MNRDTESRTGLSRRDFIARMAIITGGALSTSLATAIEAGATLSQAGTAKYLGKDAILFLDHFSEALIPTTDTPGAGKAGVSAFIDLLAGEYFTREEAATFKDKLTTFAADIRKSAGGSFETLSAEKQSAVLDKLGAEMVAAKGKTFYRELREMIISGYYTSEVGGTEELILEEFPGPFQGCVPFADIGRAYVK